MILILLTNMRKGWDYSRKEIFEVKAYDAIN